MARWKAKKRTAENKSRREKQKDSEKEHTGAWHVRKIAKYCICPRIYGSRGSKSCFAKSGECVQSHLSDEKLKFARCCGTKHILKSKCKKNTPCSDHFLKLGWGKMPCCGAVCCVLVSLHRKMVGNFDKATCGWSFGFERKCAMCKENNSQGPKHTQVEDVPARKQFLASDKHPPCRERPTPSCPKVRGRNRVLNAFLPLQNKQLSHHKLAQLLRVQYLPPAHRAANNWHGWHYLVYGTSWWQADNASQPWHHFQFKMHKRHHPETIFGSRYVEKWHATVARSEFSSQNVKNMTAGHFFACGCHKLHAALGRSSFPNQDAKNMKVWGHFQRDRIDVEKQWNSLTVDN